MNKLNFKEFSIYTGISKIQALTGDVRESFADVLYSQCNGIRAKNLAMMIFNSEGEIEVTDEDLKLIQMAANAYCTPAFIDAIDEQLNKKEE
ncbi:hypothetical protein [uncultured Culturomica sp.]|mgnify:CR=1 FL=1|uniref:hypothetical protein n=1 Tax=uncultured Culturomica sp. TaxID=1926654 RepID=UPI00033E4208|nr:hypothetical protein [uncultured Culturomica sp.]CCZ10522.1 predicted protein [Odoribacter sp. CAG:788]